MVKKKTILSICIIAALITAWPSVCLADLDDAGNALRKFLETEVNPRIWQIYDKASKWFEAWSTPATSPLPDHRLMDITSRFIENLQHGPLFVISGNIQFTHAQKLGEVSVTARLFGQGATLLNTETVACGNLVSDDDLTKLDITAIKQRLIQSRDSQLMVSQDDLRPFMIVFSDLSKDQVEQFRIEIGNSPNI